MAVNTNTNDLVASAKAALGGAVANATSDLLIDNALRKRTARSVMNFSLTTDKTFAVFTPRCDVLITAVRFIPGTTLASDATSYVVCTIQNRGAAGTATTAIASISTQATTGGVALTQFVQQSLTLTASAVNVSAGSVVALDIDATSTPAGSPVAGVEIDYLELTAT